MAGVSFRTGGRLTRKSWKRVLRTLRRWPQAESGNRGMDTSEPYPQEWLDAAAAEIGRQEHGGPADPDDIELASDVLSAAFSAQVLHGPDYMGEDNPLSHWHSSPCRDDNCPVLKRI